MKACYWNLEASFIHSRADAILVASVTFRLIKFILLSKMIQNFVVFFFFFNFVQLILCFFFLRINNKMPGFKLDLIWWRYTSFSQSIWNFPIRSKCVLKALIHRKKQWIVLRLLEKVFLFQKHTFYDIINEYGIWLIYPFYHNLFLLFMFLHLPFICYLNISKNLLFF